MGRHSECDDQMIALAREAAAKGLKRELIGPYIGMSRATFFLWMRKGREEPGSVYARFLDAVEGGESSGAVFLLDKVAAAAEHDWRAAQFLLKSRHGYTEKTETDVHISGGEDIGKNASAAERARAAARKLASG